MSAATITFGVGFATVGFAVLADEGFSRRKRAVIASAGLTLMTGSLFLL